MYLLYLYDSCMNCGSVSVGFLYLVVGFPNLKEFMFLNLVFEKLYLQFVEIHSEKITYIRARSERYLLVPV
jgi:hypothetical protein